MSNMTKATGVHVMRNGEWVTVADRSRGLTIAAVALLGVLVAVGVGIIIALSINTAATDEQVYRSCVETAGLYETTDTAEQVRIADMCGGFED